MTGCGRKQPVEIVITERSERPLSMKADIQKSVSNLSYAIGWFTPGTGHSPDIMVTGCY